MKKQKKENQFVNILLNIVIPTIILIKFSTSEFLGPIWGLVVALSFPIGYGIADFIRTRDYNFFSIIGMGSIFLTGGIALLQIPSQWLAVKEAGVPLLIGLVILLFRHKYPFVEKLLHEAIDYEKVHKDLKEKNLLEAFHKRIDKGTYLVVSSFLLSSVLNYMLAITLVTAQPGTEEFTAQLGKMTALSFPVIALPSLIVLTAAMFYIIIGITKLTGFDLESIMKQPAAKKKTES